MTRVYEAWHVVGGWHVDSDPSLRVLMCRLLPPLRDHGALVNPSEVSVRRVIRFKALGWSVTLARPVTP